MDKALVAPSSEPPSISISASLPSPQPGNPPVATRPFHRGDWVTVRPLDEILATLDPEGKLEGLPFMPEMAALAGRTLRVHRRAERTCVEGLGNRGMERTVLLEGARCDASAHDGCERRCLFFWKDAWLEPAPGPGIGAGSGPAEPETSRTRLGERLPTRREDRFICQSTELGTATREFSARNVACYLHDLRRGETTLSRFAYVLWLAFATRAWRLLTGKGYYERPAGEQKRTSSEELNLQPGELVEVKSLEEIKRTLDPAGRNRGMTFDAEMGLHCGKRFRVLAPIRQMISEETGKMLTIKNSVLLEGLTCEGICVYNCPRANYFFWRECWLRRVDQSA